jgi:hypothetical protein
MTNPLFSVYYISNGFLVMDSEEQIVAFVDIDADGAMHHETECVVDVLGFIGRELLEGYAPPGTRLEIKTYNKYHEVEE